MLSEDLLNLGLREYYDCYNAHTMRRILSVFVLAALACRALTPAIPDFTLSTAVPTAALAPLARLNRPTPEAAPTVRPLQPQLAASKIEWLEDRVVHEPAGFQVIFHPDRELFVGDQVSFEVIAPAGFSTSGRTMVVSLAGERPIKLGEATFNPFGLGGRMEATFLWAWDTTGLPAGEQTLIFTLQPDGLVWNEIVTLQPLGQRPPTEQRARWVSAVNSCCQIHYLTGTAAERDLPKLLAEFDVQARLASERIQAAPGAPIQVTLLPRLAGHGGFAASEITLSYLDRNYVAGDAAIIFHHELIHILDGRLGGDLRPPLLVEGVAVYLSGGHFKPEPLLARAAALLPPQPGCSPISPGLEMAVDHDPHTPPCGLDLYIPLNALAESFYYQKHEIGYLEAGALVEFMVAEWGWNAFSAFYRDIHRPANEDQESFSMGSAISVALQNHFGLSLAQLDERFKETLLIQLLQPAQLADVYLGLIFYDRVRTYQQLYHPEAYFLNAWLPDSVKARQLGIVADFIRSPTAVENLTLETMFVSAGAYLRQRRYPETARLLQALDSVLAPGMPADQKVFVDDPLAADYLAVVSQVIGLGYQPQRVDVNLDTARVIASQEQADLIEMWFHQSQGDWLPLTALSMASPDR